MIVTQQVVNHPLYHLVGVSNVNMPMSNGPGFKMMLMRYSHLQLKLLQFLNMVTVG